MTTMFSPLLLLLLLSSVFCASQTKQLSDVVQGTLLMLPDTVKQHLYSFEGGVYYLPPPDQTKKLFEIIEPRIVAGIMSVNAGPCQAMFLVPLLVDYVIPWFRGNDHPSGHVQDGRNYLIMLPYINEILKKPVEQILWALFLSTGELQAASSSDMRSLVRKFRDIGLIWRDLRSGLGNTNSYEERSSIACPDMLSIFMIAKCFGIDVVHLAEKTRDWAALSQQIYDGDYPEVIAQKTPYSCFQVFYAVFQENPSPIRHIEGRFIIEERAENVAPKKQLVKPKKVADIQPRPIITPPVVAAIPKVEIDPSVQNLKYFPDELFKLRTRAIEEQQNCTLLSESGIPAEVLQHTYFTKEGFLVYVPPNDGRLLFDRIPYETVRTIMMENESKHRYLFSVSIFRDYIIPVFKDHKKECFLLSGLPGINSCLHLIFMRFMWVLYFSEGFIQKNKSPNQRKCELLFKRFGLGWSAMRTGSGNTRSFENNEKEELENLMGTYFLAKWLHFSVKAIAERTLSSKISHQIQIENVPDQLRNSTMPTVSELFYVVFGSVPALEPPLIKPMAKRGRPSKKDKKAEEPQANRSLNDENTLEQPPTKQPIKRGRPAKMASKMAEEPRTKRLKVQDEVHANIPDVPAKRLKVQDDLITNISDVIVPSNHEAPMVVDPKSEDTFWNDYQVPFDMSLGEFAYNELRTFNDDTFIDNLLFWDV